MSHYARINDQNIVEQVIIAEQDFIDSGVLPGRWVQTSYTGSIRKNFGGIGYTYDEARDAFISPRPFPSWTLEEASCRWQPPTPMPEDGGFYVWDELSLSWTSSAS